MKRNFFIITNNKKKHYFLSLIILILLDIASLVIRDTIGKENVHLFDIFTYLTLSFAIITIFAPLIMLIFFVKALLLYNRQLSNRTNIVNTNQINSDSIYNSVLIHLKIFFIEASILFTIFMLTSAYRIPSLYTPVGFVIYTILSFLISLLAVALIVSRMPPFKYIKPKDVKLVNVPFKVGGVTFEIPTISRHGFSKTLIIIMENSSQSIKHMNSAMLKNTMH